jgi:mono/diheme cytochrome c family protein
MKLSHALSVAAFFAAGIFPIIAQPSNAVATAPVYAPDYTHSTEPLPDGVFAWDAVTKSVDATNGQDFARFAFSFTNIATVHETVLTTNFVAVTNVTATTNPVLLWVKKVTFHTNVATIANVSKDTNAIRAIPVAVLSVHPSCGCTTAELPPVPWLIPPGSNGTIKLSVNLAGKSGTLFKTVNFTTEKGKKDLLLRINIAPPPPMPEMTEAQRAAGIAAAKIDRQAIFKGDCASCHLPKVEGKYGQQLFDAICAICHQAKDRATMVPDLANLQVPTSEEFWRAWITSGKAGSLMPAFAAFQGGPLNDLQIASLATYLNAIHPSKAPPATNASAAK